MKRELNIIVTELRRLKESGVTAINVSDETISHLRQRTRALSGGSETETKAGSSGSVERIRSRFEAARSGRLPDFDPTPEPVVRVAASVSRRKLPDPPKIDLPEGDKRARWAALRKQVLECPTCNEQLEPGCQVVFGIGNLDADIFFVGEAPGADEEAAGEPFVGKVGEKLNGMIAGMGLAREDVYLGNIMNWRPDTPTGTGKRSPTSEEIQFCLPYLLGQVEIVQPKVLVVMGLTTVNALFGVDPKGKMKDMRGKWQEFHGIPTMITFHPAYILHSDSKSVKRTVWEDLLLVMEKVGLEISDKQRNYFL